MQLLVIALNVLLRSTVEDTRLPELFNPQTVVFVHEQQFFSVRDNRAEATP
jgi:hypothetical protein